jgi:biopolymer transport protein ExbB/TolQ
MLLVFMLANTGAILCLRLYRYNTARRESRAFIRDAGSELRDGKFDEVITIAGRNRGSPVASLVAEGLTAYASAPSEFANTEALAAAQRALQRRSKFLAAHLKDGLNTVVTIASAAPFIGFLGTVNGILGCFVGGAGSRSGALARIALEIADALTLGAMGLLVSLLAVWCFNYLRSRCEVLENEMSNAELETLACLQAHPQWRKQLELSSAANSIFAVADASAAHNWETPYDRHRPLLLAIWCCALYVAYLLCRAWLLWRP